MRSEPLPSASSVARLQRTVVLCLLGTPVALLVVWWRAQGGCSPGVALTGWVCSSWFWVACVAPLLLHPLVLGLQYALSWSVNRMHSQAATSVCRLWSAWWGEVRISLRVFGLQQPWLWRRWPDSALDVHASAPPNTVHPTAARAVVLVHGFMCNRGLWEPWLAQLHTQGIAFATVNLEPMLGSIDEYVAQIENAVQRASTAGGGRSPVVVAHSMGGLAVRAWMRATPHADQRVAHVVTVGTPHAGTWLARFGHGENARQMRIDSPWLLALKADEPAQRHSLFTCWHSCGDNIVFPTLTATLPGADNRHIPSVGHVALLDQPAVFSHVLQCLKRP